MYPLAHMLLLLVILATEQQLPRNHYMIPLTLARLLLLLLQLRKLLMWPTMTGLLLQIRLQQNTIFHVLTRLPASHILPLRLQPSLLNSRSEVILVWLVLRGLLEPKVLPCLQINPFIKVNLHLPPRFLKLKIPSSMCTGVLGRIKRVLPMRHSEIFT